MLPTTFNQTPYLLGNLKPKQVSFLQHLYDAGHNTEGDVVFKRNYLKTVANINGISWAPAWIVKDVSRVTDRGMYAVPELNELMNKIAHATAVSPGHGNDGDDLSDSAYVEDDMGHHNVSDDMQAPITDNDMISIA